MSFLGGFEAVEPRTSGFFKLKKIRTLEKDMPRKSFVIHDHDGHGNFLMNKRSINCRDEHGAWDFGGGGLDFGDSIEKTLLKEIKEEYCVDVGGYEFLGYSDLFRKMKGVDTHWVSLLFIVEINRSKVKNGEPHKFDELGWFRLDNLPNPLHSCIPYQLGKFKDKLSKFYIK